MTYATTHILVAIILIELFRELFVRNNRNFPRYYILIAAIGAILPDFDFVLVYLLYPLGFTYEQLHRTFFHTAFIPVFLVLAGMIIQTVGLKISGIRKRHMKLPTIFYILAAGATLHLFLDMIVVGTIQPLYPLSQFTIGLNLLYLVPEPLQDLILPTVDGILLMFWLFWMQFKLKIDDYF